MKKFDNEQKIKTEVDKTLASLDDERSLKGNPYFYTRLNEKINHLENQKRTKKFVSIPLKPAFLVIFLILNILTAVLISDIQSSKSLEISSYYQKVIQNEYSSSSDYYNFLETKE